MTLREPSTSLFKLKGSNTSENWNLIKGDNPRKLYSSEKLCTHEEIDSLTFE